MFLNILKFIGNYYFQLFFLFQQNINITKVNILSIMLYKKSKAWYHNYSGQRRYMQNVKEKVLKDVQLKQYTELINKIAKVEYRSMGKQYLIEFDELINIGFQTINILFNSEHFDTYNESYISTAIKWAIRNELRNRYRWYGVRQSKALSEDEHNELRDAIYKTILSTDEMNDSERTFEIKDIRKNPEEDCEFAMLSSCVKTAVMTLPRRERELIESKFFKEKKLHELSSEFAISPSRISRIIKQGLDKVKTELIKNDLI